MLPFHSAANNAGVTVAIVGLANNTNAKSEKYIFDETLNRVSANHINPYLTSGEDILVKSANTPLNNLPKMVFGSMPRDGGYLIISTQEERNSIISEYPELSHYIKNYVGSEEFIKDKHRYVFWLNEKTYQEVRDNSIVQKRVEAVKANRLASSASSTQAAAKTPYAFVQKGEYDEAYAAFKASGQDEFLQLFVPSVSSGNREYVPMGFFDKETIIAAPNSVVYNSPIWLLGLLQSRLHMIWLDAVGGMKMTQFKGKQFQKDVIIVAVGYYLRYNLSYREVQEILYDRGIHVCHTTIYRWVQEYGKILYQIWKKKNKQSFYSWKMDETYIKIKGKWHYLYRAIDVDGLTLDIWLRKKRDTQAAYAFLKRLKNQFGEPKVLVTDKAPSIKSAFRKLQKNGLYITTEHRTIKYLNNLIEQDHRPIKRRNKFYQSLRTASTTIKGMEAIRGIYKKSRKEGSLFGFSVCTEIKGLLGIPA